MGNRISEISSNLYPSKWYHVGTKQNPSDLLTRRMQLSLLIICDLCWKGVELMPVDPIQWPLQPQQIDDVPEIRQNYVTLLSIPTLGFPFDRFSSVIH